jgi:hypothetical protein
MVRPAPLPVHAKGPAPSCGLPCTAHIPHARRGPELLWQRARQPPLNNGLSCSPRRCARRRPQHGRGRRGPRGSAPAFIFLPHFSPLATSLAAVVSRCRAAPGGAAHPARTSCRGGRAGGAAASARRRGSFRCPLLCPSLPPPRSSASVLYSLQPLSRPSPPHALPPSLCVRAGDWHGHRRACMVLAPPIGGCMRGAGPCQPADRHAVEAAGSGSGRRARRLALPFGPENFAPLFLLPPRPSPAPTPHTVAQALACRSALCSATLRVACPPPSKPLQRPSAWACTQAPTRRWRCAGWAHA